MKKYINITVATILISLLLISYFQYKHIIKLRESNSIFSNNNKALFQESLQIKDQANLYKITIDQLEYMNDSINTKISNVIKENKIKSKYINQLQYINSQISKIDTVELKDTIFVEDFVLDTTITNTGYKLNLKLQYPNKIIVNPVFTNEQVIIFSNKKETVNTPNKFFLFRWFQKKHTIVEVKIINSNPYVDIKEKRFIEIIK